MLERAKLAGVETQIITGGSLSESKEAINLAKDKGSSVIKLSTRIINANSE